MKQWNRSGVVGFGIALMWLAGCSGPAYVNIPGQDADVAWNDPNMLVARNMQIAALREVGDRYLSGQRYQFLLPAGTNVKTYDDMAKALGSMAVNPVDDYDPSMMTVQVTEVKSRGAEAWVTVLIPSDPDNAQSMRHKVTVDLDYSVVSGWEVERSRLWKHMVAPLGEVTDLVPERVLPPVGPVEKVEEDADGDGEAEGDEESMDEMSGDEVSGEGDEAGDQPGK